MEGRCLDGSSKVAPDTELEGGSREVIRLMEGDRGGHGPTTGRRNTEENRRLSKTTNYAISQDSTREPPEQRSGALPVQQ
jgi:hypothetical protein